MMALNLWRAEWLKTRKRMFNRGMLGIMLVIMVGVFVAVTGIAYFFPNSELAEATEVLPFPVNMALGVSLLDTLGRLLVIVFVANSVGSEYGRDTWKAIVPRYGSRPAFLLSKWLVGLLALLLLVAGVLLAAMVFGGLGSLILGVSADPDVPEAAILMRTVAVMVLEYIFLGTLTLFGAVVTRSTIGGAIVGLLVPTLLALVTPVLRLVVTGAPVILPTAHLNNLEVRWVEFNPEGVENFTSLFNRSVPPLASALVVVGYIALLLGASLYLFKRRDMAGE